jgi:hypothetical protein
MTLSAAIESTPEGARILVSFTLNEDGAPPKPKPPGLPPPVPVPRLKRLGVRR